MALDGVTTAADPPAALQAVHELLSGPGCVIEFFGIRGLSESPTLAKMKGLPVFR